jgi:hypothetical protein
MFAWRTDAPGTKACVQAHVEMLADDWGPRPGRLVLWREFTQARRSVEGVARGWSVSARDLAASLATLAAVLVVVANIDGWNWPLIAGDRASIATLALLGVAAYLSRSPSTEPSNAVTKGLELVGAGAIVLTVAGLLIGTDVVLALLLSMLVLVWAVLTSRHHLHHGSLRGERHRSHVHPR